MEGASFHIEDDTDDVEGYGIRKPSWLVPDTTPIPTTTKENGNGSSHDDADIIRRKTEDLKPESLLKQRHVVALLCMEGVYSVGAALATCCCLCVDASNSERVYLKNVPSLFTW